jgi:hypothetical protein
VHSYDGRCAPSAFPRTATDGQAGGVFGLTCVAKSGLLAASAIALMASRPSAAVCRCRLEALGLMSIAALAVSVPSRAARGHVAPSPGQPEPARHARASARVRQSSR